MFILNTLWLLFILAVLGWGFIHSVQTEGSDSAFIPIAVISVATICRFVFERFCCCITPVAGDEIGSMAPTFRTGDVLVLRARRNRPLVRGEVVTLQFPKEAADVYRKTKQRVLPLCKRVIGLPGDKIRVEKGVGVFINGEFLDESSYIKFVPRYDLKTLADIGGMLGGRPFYPFANVVSAEQTEVVVPPEHVFVLGDNRNNSVDSHQFGFVREKTVRYSYWKILWRGRLPGRLKTCTICSRESRECSLLLSWGALMRVCDYCLYEPQSQRADGFELPVAVSESYCARCKLTRPALYFIGSKTKLCFSCIETIRAVMGVKPPHCCMYCNESTRNADETFAVLLDVCICRSCTIKFDGSIDAEFPNLDEAQQERNLSTLGSPAQLERGGQCKFCLVKLNSDSRHCFCHKCQKSLADTFKAQREIRKLNDAITLHPKDAADAALYRKRAALVEQVFGHARSLEDWSQVVRLQPDDAEARYKLAVCLASVGRVKPSMVQSTKAIVLAPDKAEYYRFRALIHSSTNEHLHAIADCSKAIVLDSQNVESYLVRSFSYLTRKEFDKGLADCDRAIELKPDEAVAYNNRGKALLMMKKYPEALVQIDRAVELNSFGYPVFFFNRGCVQEALANYTLAEQDLTRALQMDPGLAAAYKTRALVYRKLKRSAEAKEDRRVWNSCDPDRVVLNWPWLIRISVCLAIPVLAPMGFYFSMLAAFYTPHSPNTLARDVFVEYFEQEPGEVKSLEGGGFKWVDKKRGGPSFHDYWIRFESPDVPRLKHQKEFVAGSVGGNAIELSNYFLQKFPNNGADLLDSRQLVTTSNNKLRENGEFVLFNKSKHVVYFRSTNTSLYSDLFREW